MVASRCFIIFSKCKFVQGPRLSVSLSLSLIRPEAEGVLIKLGTLPHITTDEVDGAGYGWKEGTRKVQEWIQPRARVAHRWLQATVYGPVSSCGPISPLASKKIHSWVHPLPSFLSFSVSLRSFYHFTTGVSARPPHRLNIRTGRPVDNGNFHACFIVWNCIMSRSRRARDDRTRSSLRRW